MIRSQVDQERKAETTLSQKPMALLSRAGHPLRPLPEGDVATPAALNLTFQEKRRPPGSFFPSASPFVPVAPDAVQQLHEGEGEVEAEEEEEVARRLVREDRPGNKDRERVKPRGRTPALMQSPARPRREAGSTPDRP